MFPMIVARRLREEEAARVGNEIGRVSPWFWLLAPQVRALARGGQCVKSGVISHAPDSMVSGELSFLPAFHVQNKYERPLQDQWGLARGVR